MKTSLFPAVLCVVVLPMFGQSQGGRRSPEALTVPVGPHESRVEVQRDEVDARGRVTRVTRSYVRLATGLNRRESKGRQWVAAVPEFELTRDGHYVARRTRTQLVLPPDVSTEPVDLLGSDGVRLISAPIGVAVVDGLTGDTVLLGDLKSCHAEWVTPQTVVYRNCFDGLKADLVYEINRAGMEQFVVLREWIPSLEDLGMVPARVQVQVFTEFLEAPEPVSEAPGQNRGMARTGQGRAGGPGAADPDLVFGEHTRMIPGRAFAAGNHNVGVSVSKRYEAVGRRRVLIESCDYREVAPWLEQLPRTGLPGGDRSARLERGRLVPSNLPEARAARPLWAGLPFESRFNDQAWAGRSPESFRSMNTGTYLAAAGVGLVLDYTISETLADYTFQGDTTYEMVDGLALTGTTTLEGGAVMKYPPNGGLVQVHGPLVCATTRYRPAVFTARDDDSVGVILASSTGTVSDDYYGLCQLYFANPGVAVELQHVRFRHAFSGIVLGGNLTHSVRHAQMIDCRNAVYLLGATTLKAQNLLIAELKGGGAAFAFDGSPTVEADHISVVHAPTLHGPGTPTGFTLRNSLLVEIEAIPPHTEIHTEQVPDATGVFREEGAGHYYLPSDSPYRDAGTDQIDATLLADLRTLTTCPPAVHQEVTLSSPTEWNLRVERDLGAPDLGYHYPPLDLAIDTLTVVQGGSLKVGPGVAIGVFGCYGIVAEDFAQVSLVGNARDRVTLAHYTAVQEQSEPWSGSQFAPTLIYGPRHNVIAGHNSPDVALRFVDLSVLGGRGNSVLFLNNWASVRTLVARDCRFFGGYTHFASHASQLGAVNLSNNLFQRTVDDFYGWMHLTAANNLFIGGASHFACYIMVPDTWTVSDNAFHETSVLGWRSYIHRANNAYLGEVSFTDPHWTTASDTTLSTFDYLPGPLGRRYHADDALEDQGSQSAGAAGLYHHTTRVGPVGEASSLVDVGFHYVATGLDPTTGEYLPIDTDGDGIPDYLEDVDGGGGLPDPGETDWQQSENGTTGVPGLLVFTPLE